MFKHILFPTDGSDASFAAFPPALDLARTYGGKITIINMHDEFISSEERQFLRVSQDRFQELITERAEKARKEIEIALEQYNMDVPYEIVIRQGNPRRKICEICEELKGDMIVMATKGHSNLGALVIGSVAEHIVRHSPIPVLVVHA